MFWNCRGFPWKKGVSINAFIQGVDIVFLRETWESEVCLILEILGYVVHTVYHKQIGKRGQGRVACMIQEHLVEKISLYKVDKYKRLIWLKMEFRYPLFLAACRMLYTSP